MSGFYLISSAEDPFVKDCCYNCDNDYIKQDYAYLRMCKFQAKDNYKQYGYKDVGFYAFNKGIKHVRLVLFVIKAEHQRKGHGKTMFNHLLAYSRSQGKEKITLSTRKDTDAYLFWLRRGFKVTKTKENQVQMEKTL